MAVKVFTGADFIAASLAILTPRIEYSLKWLMIELTVLWVDNFVNLRHTWSSQNPQWDWSKQFVASIREAEDSPDESFLPPHPATVWGHGHWGQKKGVHRAVYWPDPVPNPYPIPITADIRANLANIRPYTTIWISDNVPYAGVVEDNINVFYRASQQTAAAASEFTAHYFNGLQHSGAMNLRYYG